jgi:XTP/dITP diphosphohydrolase
MKISFVTTNKGKVHTVRNVLEKFNIEVVHKPVEVVEIKSDDLEEVAKHKAIQAWDIIKGPLFVIDAGFYIDALKGFPKTFVNQVLKTIGIQGLLDLVKDKDRACEFRTALAYIDENRKPRIFMSRIKGTLADKPRGEWKDYFWSELFFIFISEGEDRTISELSEDEYHEWQKQRHKDSYLAKFGEWLTKK